MSIRNSSILDIFNYIIWLFELTLSCFENVTILSSSVHSHYSLLVNPLAFSQRLMTVWCYVAFIQITEVIIFTLVIKRNLTSRTNSQERILWVCQLHCCMTCSRTKLSTPYTQPSGRRGRMSSSCTSLSTTHRCEHYREVAQCLVLTGFRLGP